MLNDRVNELKEMTMHTSNPFNKAGGSDDEDNKERVSRASLEGKRESIQPAKRLSKIERENEEIEELKNMLNKEKDKYLRLSDEFDDLKLELATSKSKSRKLLVDQEKIINKLRKGKNIDLSETDDDIKSQGSSKSKTSNAEPINDPLTGMFNALNDQYTQDYLRNVFVKYLVYIAKKPK